MILGGFLEILSVFLASLIKIPWMFIMFYSVGFGIGQGFLYAIALYAGITWFKGRRGFVSGFVISALGAGGFFYSLIIQRLCNPDNEEPKPIDIGDGVI